MAKVEQLLIFLASPGEVSRERDYMEKVVDEVDRHIAASKNITLKVVRWEKDTFPDYGNDAQALINEQIARMKDYALFVGIMWNRLGMPTKRAESGTVEEFDRAVDAKKKVRRPTIMFYFRQGGFNPTSKEQLQQKAKVLDFKARVRRNGITVDYKSPSDFRAQFRDHLILWLNDHEKKATAARSTDTIAKVPRTIPPKPLVNKAEVPPAKTPSRRQITPKASIDIKAVPKTPSTTRGLTRSSAVLLNDSVYLSEKVNVRNDGNIVLRLLPRTPQEKAALNALRTQPFQSSKTVSFAYHEEGKTVRVEEVEAESEGVRTVFIVLLKPNEKSQQWSGGYGIGGLSADDLAVFRARLLLLNELPKKDQYGTSLPPQWGWGSDVPIKVEKGILPDLWAKFKTRPALFHTQATLQATYYLHASHTVESISELKIGPVKNNTVTIRFRGERNSFADQKPFIIEFTDVCILQK